MKVYVVLYKGNEDSYCDASFEGCFSSIEKAKEAIIEHLEHGWEDKIDLMKFEPGYNTTTVYGYLPYDDESSYAIVETNLDEMVKYNWFPY